MICKISTLGTIYSITVEGTHRPRGTNSDVFRKFSTPHPLIDHVLRCCQQKVALVEVSADMQDPHIYAQNIAISVTRMV